MRYCEAIESPFATAAVPTDILGTPRDELGVFCTRGVASALVIAVLLVVTTAMEGSLKSRGNLGAG
jgi:hypothetical protein